MSGDTRAVRPALPRARVPGVAIAALVLLVLAVLSLAPAVSTNLRQQRAIAVAQAQIAAQKADLAGLAAQRARWADPSYVRAQAGSRLFYVMPGTTAYRVIGAGAASSATPTPASTAQAVRPDWTSALVRSLVVAGTTSDTLAELAK